MKKWYCICKNFLKKRFDFPSYKEILYILRTLKRKEKIVFLVLAIIFIVSAFAILIKINNHFSISVPGDGGTLVEGIVGTPRFINPLLEISDADRDMTALIYSGLMRADNKGGVTLDLAESYEISEDGLIYTFVLKPDLVWHDGESLTSDDVVFTVQQAQDPKVKSLKRARWEGVIVEKIDDRTVKFFLKKPYVPFLQNTTIGILPKHVWKEALSEKMTFSEFNTVSIGSGPYKIDKINKNSSGVVSSYVLVANKKFALGKPHIKKVILKFYPSEEKLIEAYEKGEIDGVSAISPQLAELLQKKNGQLKALYLPRVFGVFMNQNNAQVFTHEEVREALNIAVDKDRIVEEVLNGFASKLNHPLPPGVFGALATEEGEVSFEKRVQEAMTLLESNGWELVPVEEEIEEETEEKEIDESDEVEEVIDVLNLAENKIFEKKTKKETTRLEFSLATSDVPELKNTALLLKEMWGKLGAKVNLEIFEIGDLNQDVIRPRKYDALLFGEIVGRDPDPFAFWHSSQRNDPGLNIAMYANITVDKLLEDARMILDDDIRREKYEQFQEEVEADTPAVFLYSPRFIYLVPEYIRGADELESITVPSERFSQIHDWYIKTYKIWKFLKR